MTIPPAVANILAQGWTQYIPLTALTHKGHKLSTLTQSGADLQIMLDLSGQVYTSPSIINFSKETKMKLLQWQSASTLFVEAIQKHLWASGDPSPGGPNARAIALSWVAHFNNIKGRPNIEDNWEVLQAYNIAIWTNYVTGLDSFDLAVFQRLVYQDLSHAYMLEKIGASTLTQACVSTPPQPCRQSQQAPAEH